MLPVHLRIIGTVQDPEHPTRPRLLFAGEVRDGQTMVGHVEMLPEEHLRWKWVRLCLSHSRHAVRFSVLTDPLGMRRGWSSPLEVMPPLPVSTTTRMGRR